MKREIKFRGIAESTDGTVRVVEYNTTTGKPNLEEWIGEWRWVASDLQYTGLKDKNGREIYDGDIVRGAHFNGSYRDGTVAWSWSLASFVIRPVNGEYFHAEISEHLSGLEVIGNIHENPELLKP